MFRKSVHFAIRHHKVFDKLKSIIPSATFSTQSTITSAHPLENGQFIALTSSRSVAAADEKPIEYKFPSIWLRDNCQCAKCFHAGSNSRTIDWTHFDVNVKPLIVQFDSQSASLRIKWSDQHESTHPLDWLLQRSFDPATRENYLQNSYRPKRRYWTKEQFDETLQTFAFQDLIETDEGLYGWLRALCVDGVAMITDTPSTEWEARRLADRIRFIRRTHYGEEFIVRAKEQTSNVAYLSTPLQMHTDLPYYEYKPGVNLLHCLVQTSSPGAYNLLADGFAVAAQLQQLNPEFFQILSTTMVDWWDVGEENGNPFHSKYRAPVLSLDYDGQLKRINHSVPQRDSHFSIPVDRVDRWYRAMAEFVRMLHADAVSFKTRPGDILTFDNTRLVHGRTGYTDVTGNTRHLVGAYVDWDEIYSRFRVLSVKLNK